MRHKTTVGNRGDVMRRICVITLVCVAASLDQVTLCDLLIEERVQTIFASATWVDLSHAAEFRK